MVDACMHFGDKFEKYTVKMYLFSNECSDVVADSDFCEKRKSYNLT